VASRAIASLEAEIRALVESAASIDELLAASATAIRESWRAFSKNPMAQGLWGASKSLPKLRALDDALNERIVDLWCRRVGEIAPASDASAVRRAVTLWVGLSTPLFDLVRQRPRGSQSALIDEFIATAVHRLREVSAAPQSRAQRGSPKTSRRTSRAPAKRPG